MPPKAAKVSDKAKAKIVEDKTFGLKNKNKSKKVNQYVNQVKKQVEQAGQPRRRPDEDPKTKAERKKEEEAARKAELALLYKPVQQAQKVPVGVDPKSILCQFFKAGTCQKGSKCKFSHDLSVERKTEKIDLYSDPRANDTMDKWDQQKLEDVVAKKQKGQLPTTDIICKYFLDAVEKSQYGWFWECPNGPTCHYRHALPPGFVLKKDKKKAEGEEEEQFSLEEWVESERKKLSGELTPVTLESFTKWKKEQLEKKEAEERERREKKESAVKAGKVAGMSGRDLFTYRPDLFVDDTDAAAADQLAHREYNEEVTDDGEPAAQPLYDETGAMVSELDEELFAAEDLENLDIDDDDDDDGEDGEDGEEDEEEDEEGGASSAGASSASASNA